ncbi:50S ribosomal protein L18e [Candidatus Parvarchaeota archaeon]|nr:50S ribosomal protein L18e [Candidatus Parvarchaeota archaeon]
MKKGPENIELVTLVKELSKASVAPIYKMVAHELSAPKRKRAAVNIGKLSHLTDAGETVLVPGKVLSSGTLKHKITVAAFSFSGAAKAAIESVGGRMLTIGQLLKENPKGTGVAIIK